MDLLFVAADPREFSGLLRHCREVSNGNTGRWSRLGRLRDYRLLMVANGAGPRLARRAADAALEKMQPRAVVSFGFCGALDPSLEIGDVCLATDVICGTERVQPILPAVCGDARRVRLLSVDRIVATAEEKSRLHQGGADAVEMEAAGVVGSVRKWRLPFLCIRSVSDLAAETFALDLNGARLPDGRISMFRVVTGALRNPRTAVPELFRLQRQTGVAARTLGDFVADCRF